MPETQAVQAEFASAVYATLLVATAVGLLLLGSILRSGRSHEIPAFGTAILLHGIREMTGVPAVQALSGLPPEFFAYVAAGAAYFISVASYMFLDQYWGPGRWSSIRRAWQFHAFFATGAVAWDIATGTPGQALAAQGMLTVTYRVILLGNIVTGSLKTRPEDIWILYGLGVVFVTTLHDVAVGREFVPWEGTARPIGVIAVTSTLVASMLLRARADQRQLGTLEAQLDTARKIQESLLPPKSAYPECPVSVRHVSMDAVGGDIYSFTPAGDKRFALLLADVTGHGIPAALLASMVKTASEAERPGETAPGDFMTALNRRLYSSLDGYLVTMVCLVADLRTGEARIANAGHPKPLIFPATGAKPHTLADRDPALGLSPATEYATSSVKLHPGDRIAVYTDGLSEAANAAGDEFSDERVTKVLGAHIHLSVESWTERLLQVLQDWRGTSTLELEDDLTLIAFEVPAPDRP